MLLILKHLGLQGSQPPNGIAESELGLLPFSAWVLGWKPSYDIHDGCDPPPSAADPGNT